MEVGVSLGSNLGDRMGNLNAAAGRIAGIPGVTITATAPVYETEPVGVQPQYADMTFLNTVLVLSHDGTIDDLHQALLNIETAIGRSRVEDKYAPRTLDIDILYAGDLVRNDQLVLPHPQCAKRRFVLQPLADVRPDLQLPGFSTTVTGLLGNLPDGEQVSLLSAEWYQMG